MTSGFLSQWRALNSGGSVSLLAPTQESPGLLCALASLSKWKERTESLWVVQRLRGNPRKGKVGPGFQVANSQEGLSSCS